MASQVSCPHCKGLILVTPETAGKNVCCPHCNGRVVIRVRPAAKPANPATIVQQPSDDPLDFLNSGESTTEPTVPASPLQPSRAFTSTPVKRKPTAQFAFGNLPIGARIGLAIFGVLALLALFDNTGGVGGIGTMSREQFRQAVIGKTKQQVLSAVGRPEFTTRNEANGDDQWTYRGKTRDTVAGTVDPLTTIMFRDGGVAYKID